MSNPIPAPLLLLLQHLRAWMPLLMKVLFSRQERKGKEEIAAFHRKCPSFSPGVGNGGNLEEEEKPTNEGFLVVSTSCNRKLFSNSSAGFFLSLASKFANGVFSFRGRTDLPFSRIKNTLVFLWRLQLDLPLPPPSSSLLSPPTASSSSTEENTKELGMRTGWNRIPDLFFGVSSPTVTS